MSEVIFSSIAVGRMNDLLHMAQKRLADMPGYNADIARNILSEMERLVTDNALIGSKEEATVYHCGECETELHFTKTIEGCVHVEPCPHCIEIAEREAVYQDRADTEERIAKHRASVCDIARSII